jgi:RNA polymerase sigma-70 factor, ECF subfamily
MIDSSDEFEAIYESNAPLIYRFMFWRTKDQALSEDLTSSVFEKAWRSRGSFKGGSAKAWLYRIAHNTLVDHWRKRRDLPVEDEAVLDLAASGTVSPEDAFDSSMRAEKLRRALAALPEDMRKVVELRFMEGRSCRQVGERLGLSESNVRVIQYRALRKLKGYLK